MTLLRRSFLHKQSQGDDRRCRRFRPGIEILEDRLVPAILTVTTLADSGAGSLRQAITDANANAGADTITFSVTGIINLAGALPNLSNQPITIQGPGAAALTVRRDTGGNYRLFTLNVGATANVSGLSLTNGSFNGGGAILVPTGSTLTLAACVLTGNFGGSSATGGAISSSGTLTVTGCTITGNQAGGAGGISNFNGTLTISNSTIAGNQALGDGGGIVNFGGPMTITGSTLSGNTTGRLGGAFSMGNSTVTVVNTTISGNTCVSQGGAIANLTISAAANLTLLHVTLADNSDGILNQDGLATLTLGNTIIADLINSGTVVSQGHNLLSDTSFTLTGPGDQNNVDPLLGPLQDNGGPTFTHALPANSPARDAGNNFLAGLTTDQRGQPRVQFGMVDVGAFELALGSVVRFEVTGLPALVVPGQAVLVTVRATDAVGLPSSAFSGPIVFASSDPLALLPSNALLMGGVGTFSVTFQSGGVRSLTVTDPTTGTIQGQAFVTVQAATTTTLTASSATTVFGQPVVFTATVSTLVPELFATGTVHFLVDGVLAAIDVPVSGSTAFFVPMTPLTIGVYLVTAVYQPTAAFLSSSASPLVHTVFQAETLTSLAVSASPAFFAEPLTLTATVTVGLSGSGIVDGPTQTVTFRDGATILGTVAVNNGAAELVTAQLLPGTHTLTATYTGDLGFHSSASAEVPLTVTTSPLLAVGTDAGGPAEIHGLNAVTHQELFVIQPYAADFLGGVRVALADVNHDGVPDVIAVPGPGLTADIRIFNGLNGLLLGNVLNGKQPFGPGYRKGLYVAAGDLNGDGLVDIVVGQDRQSLSLVRACSGQDGKRLASFRPFGPFYRGGVTVAAGDVNGDGKAEIIVGRLQGKPLVRRFRSGNGTLVRQWTAAGPIGATDGVFVATGDVDGDGLAEVLVGQATGGSQVQVFRGLDGVPLGQRTAFDPGFLGGVRLAALDVNGDGKAEIVATQGPPGDSRVHVFAGPTLADLDSFFATDPPLAGGFFVA